MSHCRTENDKILGEGLSRGHRVTKINVDQKSPKCSDCPFLFKVDELLVSGTHVSQSCILNI